MRRQMWISKEDYDENGPLIVHRKVWHAPLAVRMRARTWAWRASKIVRTGPAFASMDLLTDALRVRLVQCF